MGIIEKFFPAKAAITSASVRADISRCESEIAAHRAKIASAESEIATLDDAAHVKVIENNDALRRAIARLESRVATLDTELPAVLAAEEAVAATERDTALVKRAEAARKDNVGTAKKLLKEYEAEAASIASILERLAEIDAEREAVNKALRSNPVAETIASYNTIHRSTPEAAATEQRASVPHWVYVVRHSEERSDGSIGGAKWGYHDEEVVIRATLDERGAPLPLAAHPTPTTPTQQILAPPHLEMREVVVSRTKARPPRCVTSLNDVRLPPAFTDTSYIWPRS